MNDTFTFTPILTLIILLFTLLTLEVRRSILQSRHTKNLLIVDRDQLRVELAESTQALRESEFARVNELAKAAEFGRLAQGLFHDLMSPLTSMILHTESLKNNETTKRSLEKIINAGDRMARYVHDIRATLSREGSIGEVDLEAELHDIVDLLSFKTRQHGIEVIIMKTELQTRPIWTGNHVKIKQIFSNIISNSIDAFESVDMTQRKNLDKMIEIFISKDAGNFEVTVLDNGSGISEENLKKIFEPFFTTKAFDKGTGIGLTTVKSIVEKELAGSIEIESREGKGTRVKIIFPIKTK